MAARNRPSRSNDDKGDDRAAQRLRLADDEQEATDVRQGFRLLPQSIVSGRIFDFLAAVDSMDFLHQRFAQSHRQSTHTALAMVCREWRSIVRSRVTNAKHDSLTLFAKTGEPSERDRFLRFAAEHGNKTLALRIFIDDPNVNQAHNDAEWWEAFFRCLPNVIRLDLENVQGELFVTVLSAASRLCPRVQSLHLSFGSYTSEDIAAIPAMMEALDQSLQCWYQSQSCGGLRVLSLPSFISMVEDLYAVFFRAVAGNCPRLEYLVWDMYAGGLNRGWWSTDLSMGVWAEFCRRCPLVRGFPWGVVPFTPEYVKHFVAVPKPHVQELTILRANYINWSDMKGLTAVHQLVKAAPRLRSFHFELTDAHADRSKLLANSLSEVGKTLAAHCPDLERIALYDCCDKGKYRISAEAIEALVKLESLHQLTLPSASIGDQTLVEVLRTTCRSVRNNPRTIMIHTVGYIHNAVVELLQAIKDEPTDGFKGVSLMLSVTGACSKKKDGSILPPSPQRKLHPVQLKEIVEAVKRKHRGSLSCINVRVVTQRVSNRVMHYISTFNLRIDVNRHGARVCGDDTVGGVVIVPEQRIKHY